MLPCLPSARRSLLPLLAGWLLAGFCLVPTSPPRAAAPPAPVSDRSPIDLVLSTDEKWLLTANHTADTVSLVRVDTGKVVAELPAGARPAAVALAADGRTALVTASFSGELIFFTLDAVIPAPGGTAPQVRR